MTKPLMFSDEYLPQIQRLEKTATTRTSWKGINCRTECETESGQRFVVQIKAVIGWSFESLKSHENSWLMDYEKEGIGQFFHPVDLTDRKKFIAALLKAENVKSLRALEEKLKTHYPLLKKDTPLYTHFFAFSHVYNRDYVDMPNLDGHTYCTDRK